MTSSTGHSGAPFHPTRWSIVCNAQDPDPTIRRAALDELCRAYWTPLYTFLRRRGQDEHDAMDMVQEFLVQLLQGGVDGADPDKGRFRSYLLGALRNFVGKWQRKQAALKRGGAVITMPLNFAAAEHDYRVEPVSTESPERAFDRRFALTLLDRSLARIGEDYADRGRRHVFACLAPFLGTRPTTEDYRRAAQQLDMSQVAVKVTVHRMRARLRRCLLDEVAKTVTDPRDAQAELVELFTVLGNP